MISHLTQCNRLSRSAIYFFELFHCEQGAIFVPSSSLNQQNRIHSVYKLYLGAIFFFAFRFLRALFVTGWLPINPAGNKGRGESDTSSQVGTTRRMTETVFRTRGGNFALRRLFSRFVRPQHLKKTSVRQCQRPKNHVLGFMNRISSLPDAPINRKRISPANLSLR
jgi:hypothetical protein